MMRSMRRASLLAAVSIAVFLLALPAEASETVGQGSVTIRVISIPQREVLRDKPPKGLNRGEASKGDVANGTTILRNAVVQFDKPKGAVVGSDRYILTFTSPTRALIKVEARLPGGTVRAQGRASMIVAPITISVTGGSGTYAGARGTSEARSLAGGRSLNVYRLRLP